ncbi:MAG: protoheme IX farnesyltransferase [Hyphomicrobiales bacterium]|nr:MAG: protoheme IX farnesyltransferase [Hyphomicrobiales bacterium]
MAYIETKDLDTELAWTGGMATVGDFMALMKPRVMSLVIFTAFVGMIVAPTHSHPVLAAISLTCIAIGAGASGALNMWFDSDIDAVMSRTANRPIPAGRMTREEALAFGMTLSLGSVLVLGLVAGWLAAGLLAFTIFFYVAVYTMWLKRSTPQNIVIGGASGALPPVIGWVAMTGSISVESLALFLLIFMWTPPHFWALSLFKSGDYQRAGVPMLPVVAGRASTRRHIFAYSLALVPVGILPALIGPAGIAYGCVAAVLGAVFLGLAYNVLQAGDDADAERRAAIRLFTFSIFYLFLLFATLATEHLLGFGAGA